MNTTYSVTVTDKNGCPGMASKTVSVMDIAGGNKGDKIVVCHKGQNSLVIAAPAVASHLDHGDMLGACAEQSLTVRAAAVEEASSRLAVKAGPNPSRNFFTLQLSGQAENRVQISVYDALGRVVEKLSVAPSLQSIRLGGVYVPGVYLVEVVQGTEKLNLRLVKEK